MSQIESLLALCRAYVEATDERRYSHAQYVLTLLADAVRRTPAWMLPSLVEPAAEVERELSCGTKLTIRNEDGNAVLVVCDHDGEVLAPVLTAGEATQLRADLQRVIAAMEVR